LRGLLLLELEDGVVEGGDDVEGEDEELQLGPVLPAEGAEGEEAVVHLEGEPGPLHLPRLTLVLVEVFEGLRLLRSHVVELGFAVQFLLDLPRSVHHADLSPGGASQRAVLIGETALVPAELVDVELVLELIQSAWGGRYLSCLRRERRERVVGLVSSSSGLR
jgi:hypothetical protein